MKKIICLFLLLCVCMIGSAENNVPIGLKGGLKTGSSKNQSEQLQVLLSEHEIRVNFLDCFNNLTVEIENENGITVYNNTVNSCVTNSISINIQNFPLGWYKIKITDQNGGYVEGWFFIE